MCKDTFQIATTETKKMVFSKCQLLRKKTVSFFPNVILCNNNFFAIYSLIPLCKGVLAKRSLHLGCDFNLHHISDLIL